MQSPAQMSQVLQRNNSVRRERKHTRHQTEIHLRKAQSLTRVTQKLIMQLERLKLLASALLLIHQKSLLFQAKYPKNWHSWTFWPVFLIDVLQTSKKNVKKCNRTIAKTICRMINIKFCGIWLPKLPLFVVSADHLRLPNSKRMARFGHSRNFSPQATTMKLTLLKRWNPPLLSNNSRNWSTQRRWWEL